ncbi:MAG: hypothetical protein ACO1TE_15040 [Prosthecobacter sp.]
MFDQIDSIEAFVGESDRIDEHSLTVLRGKLLQLRMLAEHELSDKDKAIHDLASLVTRERRNRLVAHQLQAFAA